MTEEQLWNHFLKRNPNLEASEVSMTKENMRKFFSATFKAGYEHGQMQERALLRMRDAVSKGNKSDFGSMFDFLTKK
jgi:hypothetical protein